MGSALTRTEIKSVIGEGDCRIATRNADGSWRGWSTKTYTVEQAQSAYSSKTTYAGGVYASGYCCANCSF